MRGSVKEGEKGEKKGKKQHILLKLLKQMDHRYKGIDTEEDGAEGRNKKKRLVMSMLSVTSFVDSHQVSMTTVKSLLREQYKTSKLHLV